MGYAKNDRDSPCTCGRDVGKGYYELGCIIHDELAYRRHSLKLLENFQKDEKKYCQEDGPAHSHCRREGDTG